MRYLTNTTRQSSSKLPQEQLKIILDSKTPLVWRIQDQQPPVPESALPTTRLFKPTLSGHLTLPMLPSKTTKSHAYPNLKSVSLISIVQLCASNFYAIFTKKDITIFNSDKTHVFNVTSNASGGLCDFTIETTHLEPPPTSTINRHAHSVLRLDKTKS